MISGWVAIRLEAPRGFDAKVATRADEMECVSPRNLLRSKATMIKLKRTCSAVPRRISEHHIEQYAPFAWVASRRSPRTCSQSHTLDILEHGNGASRHCVGPEEQHNIPESAFHHFSVQNLVCNAVAIDYLTSHDDVSLPLYADRRHLQNLLS